MKNQFDEVRYEQSKREDFIARNIPPKYRETIDRAQLKNPAAFDKVQLWTPGGAQPGLIVFGDTGRGKTRAVFHRLATLHRKNVAKFVALTADELKRKLITAALAGEVEGDDQEHEVEWSETGPIYHKREPSTFEGKLRAADVVFVDDLTQTKLTAHYAERLFALVEYRTGRGLPLIVTAQMDGDRLARKLAGWEDQFADTAACLVRRLRDYCQPVNFGFDHREAVAATPGR